MKLFILKKYIQLIHIDRTYPYFYYIYLSKYYSPKETKELWTFFFKINKN